MLLQLFLSYLQIGLFSIGGGYAAMPLIKAQTVDIHGWLTMSAFTDLVTIAEMTPGPIAVNSATFVGLRLAGVPGALAATAGCILPSCVIVPLLGWVYYRYRTLSGLQSVLSCLRACVVALIASAGLGILIQVLFGGAAASFGAFRYEGALLFLGAFILLRKVKMSPILVMLLCGAAGVLTGVLIG